MELQVKLNSYEYKWYHEYAVKKDMSVTQLVFLSVLVKQHSEGLIRKGLSDVDLLTMKGYMLMQAVMLKELAPANDNHVITVDFEDDEYAYCQRIAESRKLNVEELIRHAIILQAFLETQIRPHVPTNQETNID